MWLHWSGFQLSQYKNNWATTQPWNLWMNAGYSFVDVLVDIFKTSGYYHLSDPCLIQFHFFSFLVTALSRPTWWGQHGISSKYRLGFCVTHCAVINLTEELECIKSWFQCLHGHWFDVWLQEDHFNWCHHLSFSQDIITYDEVNELEFIMCSEKSEWRVQFRWKGPSILFYKWKPRTWQGQESQRPEALK